MLRKQNRLQRADFVSLEKGRRAASEHFSCTQKDAESFRVAVIVSKKVAKNASERHLLKRRVLSVIEEHTPSHGLYSVYARKNSTLLPFSKIKEEIRALLRLPTSV